MRLTYIHSIFSRKETRLFIICTATSGLLQFVCRKCIESHPEFLEEPTITITIKDPFGSGETEQITNEIATEISEITKESRIRRLINIIKRLRGGQLKEKLLEILLKLLLKNLMKLAAKKGACENYREITSPKFARHKSLCSSQRGKNIFEQL